MKISAFSFWDEKQVNKTYIYFLIEIVHSWSLI